MPLYHIIQAAKSELIDTQMDLIYDYIDTLMSLGDWATLNKDLDTVILYIDDISLDCLLGIACASLPGENNIDSRAYFMAKCKEKYPNDALWHGL